MLLSRLPRDARTWKRTTESDGSEDWGLTEELLALLIEVTSVSGSGKQLKKPIDIPRPSKKKRRTGLRHPDDPAVKQGAPTEAPAVTAAPAAAPAKSKPVAADPYKRGVSVLRASSRPKR